MKWNEVIAQVVKNGIEAKFLNDTADEMQKLLEFVKGIEPELYWDFRGSVLKSINGSSNDCHGFEED